MGPRRCPHCKKAIVDAAPVDGALADVAQAQPSWAPFCCERCQLADLQKWLGGAYAIAGRPLEEGDLPPPRDDDET